MYKLKRHFQTDLLRDLVTAFCGPTKEFSVITSQSLLNVTLLLLPPTLDRDNAFVQGGIDKVVVIAPMIWTGEIARYLCIHCHIQLLETTVIGRIYVLHMGSAMPQAD